MRAKCEEAAPVTNDTHTLVTLLTLTLILTLTLALVQRRTVRIIYTLYIICVDAFSQVVWVLCICDRRTMVYILYYHARACFVCRAARMCVYS